ncbi:MAG TPA: TolC family protein [Acidisarcina sp.]
MACPDPMSSGRISQAARATSRYPADDCAAGYRISDLRSEWSLIRRTALCLAALLFTATLPIAAQTPVSLYTAVDLALRNSPAVRAAIADVQRASASMAEARDAYKPNVVAGSGLGYSYGFPLGQPSVFNVTSQSLILSYSQPDYVRSSRAALHAAELALKDTRQQVVLDTALAYIQLDTITRERAALDAQQSAAERLATIEQQRVEAGLEGRTELLRAELTGAQIRLKNIHIEDDAEVAGLRLAHLTGLPAASFTTATESIPAAPSFITGNSALSAEVHALSSAGVQAAYASAKSRAYVAMGDRRQRFRPQISFFAQYSLFSNFNNYSTYYRSFQPNNFGIGISISLPIFDASRTDKARESAAESAHATAEADTLRDQTSEQAMQLEKSMAELSAREAVARLQSELAESELQTVVAQLESGSGPAARSQLTPRDEQQARIQERQRYQELLDSRLDLARAQLNLLRIMGSIEDWARKQPSP